LFGSDESGQEQPAINMEQIMEMAKRLISGKKKKKPVVEEETPEGEGLSSAIARQLRRR
jgi:shikimate kinase